VAGAEDWVRFMDEVGIESTVVYPTLGLGFGHTANIDWGIAVAHAYNDWLYDTFTSQNARIRGVGLLPLQEPQAAVEELRRMVRDLGFVGAVIPSNGWQQHLGAADYWPIYAAAEELGVCLGIHGGNHGQIGMDHVNLWWVAHAIGHPHGISIALGTMVANGVFDRFPRLRVAYLEAGVAWLFTVLERFSGSYAAFIPDDPRGVYLKLAPGQSVGDYLVQKIRDGNIFIGCEGDERLLPYAVKTIGPRGFVYSSDFPHEVSAATCRAEIDELLESDDIDENVKQYILCDNVAQLYQVAPA
jgi:predicted TIM-barrel fold metal-dependent hydrolase